MKYYKVLNDDGGCCNGGLGKWYLPTKKKDGTWKPGKWMPKVEGALKPCKNGYHICRRQDLVHWLDEAIFEVEYRGEIVKGDNKCVVRKARLICKLETWNEKSARLFAADCAERVLPIFESEYPEDDRPRKAIQAARDYANGKISAEELSAARYAARYAADYAARSAAYYAAYYAARSAARSAADSAADYAADYAADSAAYFAARSAARSAADSAADYAADYAADSAERKWQTGKLFEYLEAE